MEIKDILRAPHQIFIHGHFLTGNEWEDWILFRADVDFEDDNFARKTYLLRNTADAGKTLMVRIAETHSQAASGRVLDFSLSRSTASHLSSAEADPSQIDSELGGLGIGFLWIRGDLNEIIRN